MEYIYTPSSTDITIRWRKIYGYVPASETPSIKQKWADHKAKMAKDIEDLHAYGTSQLDKHNIGELSKQLNSALRNSNVMDLSATRHKIRKVK